MELTDTEKRIFTVLRRRMQHRDVPHPPAMILFCGIPGSGKTTLAQRLVRDLSAQYVQNDDARILARQQQIANFKPHAITKALVHAALTEDANKLIIFDATIDRDWRSALAFCREHGAKPIVIRITVSMREALARMQRRGRDDDESPAELVPDRYANFLACKKELPADVELSVSFDYEQVLAAVREKLTRL